MSEQQHCRNAEPHGAHDYRLWEAERGWSDQRCAGHEAMAMSWGHITPAVQEGDTVERGDVIGTIGGPGPSSTVTIEPKCECWPTPPEQHFVHYGATEPASAIEFNPQCPKHGDPSRTPTFDFSSAPGCYCLSSFDGEGDGACPVHREPQSPDRDKLSVIIDDLRAYAGDGTGDVYAPAELFRHAAAALAAPVAADRDKLAEAFAEYLGTEVYWCHRDYSAWAHGTMSLDDFWLARDDDEVIDSLIEIALESAGVAPQGPSAWRCGKCDREAARGEDDGQIPEHHRTCARRDPSPDRENLIERLCEVLRSGGWEHSCRWIEKPENSAKVYAAVAAPVAVDEAKLAKAVRDALPREVLSWGANEKPEWRYRGIEDADRHVAAIVPAVIASLTEPSSLRIGTYRQVDEAKLAKVIGSADQSYNLSDRSAESFACGAPDYRSHFMAHVIAEWLNGDAS